MGGTDYIENPGPYLHRSSKRAPHMGVLSTPFQAKLPAPGVPLPPLDESRFASREDAIQAYAARLDALRALDGSAMADAQPAPDPQPALPQAAEAAQADPPEALETFEEKMESMEEAVLQPVVAANGTSGQEMAFSGTLTAAGGDPKPNPLVPDRSGPFEPVSTPLYPAEHDIGRPNGNGIRTPRWRGG